MTILLLNSAQILLSALTARSLGPQDYGKMAIVSRYAAFGFSLLLPIVIVAAALLLRPSQSHQAAE
jgi:hypothetical protein